MQKPSEGVFCSNVTAHYGIFILIASETHLKRWAWKTYAGVIWMRLRGAWLLPVLSASDPKAADMVLSIQAHVI